MAEKVASIGYAALGVQTDATTPIVPTVFVPYYKNSMRSDNGMVSDEPIVGNKFLNFQQLAGLRSHRGSLDVMAEPNTAEHWVNMLLTRSGRSGAGPYTGVYGLSNSADPKVYTLDIYNGDQVERYWGVGASKMQPGFNDGKMIFSMDLSALGSFQGREIASVSTATITLKTDYDAEPTKGLVVGDLVTVRKVDGSTTTNYTISSLTATTVTLSATAAAFAAGDMIVLRPQTPSYTIRTPFLWQRTEFRFGADAAAALSASQTRLEEGSEYTIENMFDDEDGNHRSGGYDPASLIRTDATYSFKIKKFLDGPADIKDWNAHTKKACVVRHFSETGYELRFTMNNIKPKSNERPTEKSGVVYQEIEYGPGYDVSDGQGMSVTVINALATV